jgi:hypothetical protein
VPQSAYSTARSMGVGRNDKIMLALFEAGLVESEFTNSAVVNDHDSVGFLQQRPSQGWGTVAEIMDVPHATRSFVNHARKINADGHSAGWLAQKVQVSAYPGRYDVREGDAKRLLAQMVG